MIGVYVVWKKVISTPVWYVVCEINNETCLNKWKCHKVDIRVIFSIFFYGVRLDPSWYDLYVKYVGRMKAKFQCFLITATTLAAQTNDDISSSAISKFPPKCCLTCCSA